VEDAELLLRAIAGFDPRDSQSDPSADEFIESVEGRLQSAECKKFKIAMPKEIL